MPLLNLEEKAPISKGNWVVAIICTVISFLYVLWSFQIFLMVPMRWALIETLFLIFIMFGIPALASILTVKLTRFSSFWGVVFLLTWLAGAGVQLFSLLMIFGWRF